MADPLSAAGSAIAVVGLAAQSCEVLCRLLRSFNEAEEDLIHHVTTLQALKSTFIRISDLEHDLSSYDWVRQALSSRLLECSSELKAMEDFVRPWHDELKNGRTRRVWVKTKWVGSHQKQKIDRSMTRIESFCMTFSLDLIMINTRMALQSSAQSPLVGEPGLAPSSLALNETQSSSVKLSHNLEQLQRGLRSPSPGFGGEVIDIHVDHSLKSLQLQKLAMIGSSLACETNDGGLGAEDGMEHTQMRTLRPGDIAAASFRRVTIGNLESLIIPISWWLSNVNTTRCTGKTPIPPHTGQIDQGHGVGITVTLPWNITWTCELMVYFWRKISEPSLSFSFDLSLSYSRVVSWETRSVSLAMCGDVESMKIAFKNSEATPFDVLPDGSTYLHLAAMRDQLGMTSFLIEQGARVNAMNGFGESPLHRAILLAKDARITNLLLDSGGDLCNLTLDRKTPLHTFFNPLVEQIVLSPNSKHILPEFLAPDARGRTLLHYLAWSSKTSPKTFEFAHTCGLDILNNKDNDGKSVLHFAAQRGNAAIIAYVLSASSSTLCVNGRDYTGKTPMHYAVESRRAADLIAILVRNGADIDPLDHERRTPLHLATKRDNLVAVQTLVRYDQRCEITMRSVDGFGQTTLQLAGAAGAYGTLAELGTVLGQQHVDLIPQQELEGKVEYCANSHHQQFRLVDEHPSRRYMKYRVQFIDLLLDKRVVWSLGFAMVIINIVILVRLLAW